MNHSIATKKIISEVLTILSKQEAHVLEHMLIAANYPALSEEIPDNAIEFCGIFSLEEACTDHELDENEHLSDHKLAAVIECMGGNLICVSYDEKKLGQVFYYDMDFGLFYLDKNIEDFTSKLAYYEFEI